MIFINKYVGFMILCAIVVGVFGTGVLGLIYFTSYLVDTECLEMIDLGGGINMFEDLNGAFSENIRRYIIDHIGSVSSVILMIKI